MIEDAFVYIIITHVCIHIFCIDLWGVLLYTYRLMGHEIEL